MVDKTHMWINIYTYTHFLWTGIGPEGSQSLRIYENPPLGKRLIGGFIF